MLDGDHESVVEYVRAMGLERFATTDASL